jgi:hypothetical protein
MYETAVCGHENQLELCRKSTRGRSLPSNSTGKGGLPMKIWVGLFLQFVQTILGIIALWQNRDNKKK